MKMKANELTISTWAQLLRTSQRFTDQVEAALKQEKMPSLGWYDILLELRRVGSAGLRQFELGEKLLLPKHNLSRRIDKLQQEGLAERYLCESDGRGNVIAITADGEALLKRMWPVYAAQIETLLEEKLNVAELQQLSVLLGKLL
jgi:DNA-binding MarR family transcriptional regulator